MTTQIQSDFFLVTSAIAGAMWGRKDHKPEDIAKISTTVAAEIIKQGLIKIKEIEEHDHHQTS